MTATTQNPTGNERRWCPYHNENWRSNSRISEFYHMNRNQIRFNSAGQLTGSDLCQEAPYRVSRRCRTFCYTTIDRRQAFCPVWRAIVGDVDWTAFRWLFPTAQAGAAFLIHARRRPINLKSGHSLDPTITPTKLLGGQWGGSVSVCIYTRRLLFPPAHAHESFTTATCMTRANYTQLTTARGPRWQLKHLLRVWLRRGRAGQSSSNHGVDDDVE